MASATYNSSTGKLEVTHRGETREFDCIAVGYGDIGRTAFGVFGGKYSTGAKVWPCNVTLMVKTGELRIEAGGYSRGARQSGAVSIVGWMADLNAYRAQV